MRRLIRTSCLFAVLAAAAGCSILAPDVEQIDDLDAEIARAVADNGIPSLAAWVARDGAIAWEGYYGYADVAQQQPATQTTVYGLASVSKLVVVTAVMQLVEQGLLELDDDVNRHIDFSVRNPAFPDDAVTVHHLLTHSSGLAWPEDDSEVPGFYEHLPPDEAAPLGQWLPDLIVPSGGHFVPAVWKDYRPGERELYSNIGVSLLAYVVEVVSGVEFADYSRQNIFEPLQMESTSFRYADLDLIRVATTYASPTGPIPAYEYASYPSGELKSTIKDFSRFMLAYVNGGEYGGARILTTRSVDRILEMTNPISGLCLIWNRTLGDWYGHAGGKPGIAAYAELQRERKLALMVVSNMRTNTVYPGNRIHALVRRIADAQE